MAIFRLYPEKDTFLSSNITASNAGLDEIVEIASFPQKTIEGKASRILTQYKLTEIQDVLNRAWNFSQTGESQAGAKTTYTEEDITEAMESNNMKRDEVIKIFEEQYQLTPEK